MSYIPWRDLGMIYTSSALTAGAQAVVSQQKQPTLSASAGTPLVANSSDSSEWRFDATHPEFIKSQQEYQAKKVAQEQVRQPRQETEAERLARLEILKQSMAFRIDPRQPRQSRLGPLEIPTIQLTTGSDSVADAVPWVAGGLALAVVAGFLIWAVK